MIFFFLVAYKGTSYDKKKRQRIEEWTKLRDTFQNIGTSTYTLERNACDRCVAEEVSLLRCVDCCQWLLLCESCLVAQHNYPHLHIFEGWNVSYLFLVASSSDFHDSFAETFVFNNIIALSITIKNQSQCQFHSVAEYSI